MKLSCSISNLLLTGGSPILLIIILVVVFFLVVMWIVNIYLREQRRKRSLAARKAAAKKREAEQRAGLQRTLPPKNDDVSLAGKYENKGTGQSSLSMQIAASKAEPDPDMPAGSTLKDAVAAVRAASSPIVNAGMDFDQLWNQVVQEVETLGLTINKDEPDSLNQEETMEAMYGKPIIRVEYVTMRFKVSTSTASGLKEYIIQRVKRQVNYRTFRALNNISFNVYKGEVVGIIGTNGSGKSTLLKIISGALKPTKGRVVIDQKKVQLLTLGTGFDAELTAKENVYLNGSIIGYSKEFLDAHYNDIVEFAELQDFMDEKVKNFSSGMVSRLGFAIATIGDAAEILILDEVLAVGDEFFRKKSLARIKEMIHGGSTVLIVSHNMGTIIENCSKVVWIEKGELMMVGDPKVVCKAYRNQHTGE